jgi:hypothetical protein
MVRHMYAATTALALDYGGSVSPISKGNARGERAMCILWWGSVAPPELSPDSGCNCSSLGT